MEMKWELYLAQWEPALRLAQLNRTTAGFHEDLRSRGGGAQALDAGFS
jgi:hypothetical protein